MSAEAELGSLTAIEEIGSGQDHFRVPARGIYNYLITGLDLGQSITEGGSILNQVRSLEASLIREAETERRKEAEDQDLR